MTDKLDVTQTPDATLRSPTGRANPSEVLPPLDTERYRVAEGRDAQLGKGGQGVVWRAHDEFLRREVALKVLRPDAAQDPSVVAAFLREARLTAMLEHPGIVPLHDVGQGPDGNATLVLRRIVGRSLAEVLAEATTLEARLRLVPVVLRACQAVAFAHARGVVHRDLKPQNVMVGELGQTYVVDWGLARVEQGPLAALLTDALETPGVVGTPAYMSPEQALGLAADARSDVWGLGACLYQVLAGVPPLSGATLESVLGKATDARVTPVREREPGVPADLAAICHKALSPERADRYASAVALAADLEAWLTGRTVSAREYTRLELLRRALAANRVAVAVALIGLVVVALVVARDEVRIRQERNEARAFAKGLLFESTQFAQSSTPDVEFLGVLTRRTREWLSREDLDHEERHGLCALLVSLASLHRELDQREQERAALDDAVRLAAEGLGLAPTSTLLFACSISARTDLAHADVVTGRVGDPDTAFVPLERELRAWTGPAAPRLTLAHADLLNAWADAASTSSPRRSAELSVGSATLARGLLAAGDASTAVSALAYGTLGVTGLWGLGRRDEALELARAYAAAPLCEEKGVAASRNCQVALDALRQQLDWRGDPEATTLEAEVVRREAEFLERSPDSQVVLQNATFSAFERGDFEASARTGGRLLALEVSQGALGALAAVLAGQPLPDVTGLATDEPLLLLATAFHRLSRSDWRGAAQALRETVRPNLWFLLSWTPRPAPKLAVPPAAAPAWERFLTDFTRAYGLADEGALEQSLLDLATALDALP